MLRDMEIPPLKALILFGLALFVLINALLLAWELHWIVTFFWILVAGYLAFKGWSAYKN